MSLLRRRRAVSAAEARAAARIAQARGSIEALRQDRDSAVYPLTLVLAGLGAGALVEHVATRPSGASGRDADAASASARTAGLMSAAGLASAARLLQSALPLWQSMQSSGPGSRKGGASDAGAGRADG